VAHLSPLINDADADADAHVHAHVHAHAPASFLVARTVRGVAMNLDSASSASSGPPPNQRKERGMLLFGRENITPIKI
jgi:hypothetical protein